MALWSTVVVEVWGVEISSRVYSGAVRHTLLVTPPFLIVLCKTRGQKQEQGIQKQRGLVLSSPSSGVSGVQAKEGPPSGFDGHDIGGSERMGADAPVLRGVLGGGYGRRFVVTTRVTRSY